MSAHPARRFGPRSHRFELRSRRFEPRGHRDLAARVVALGLAVLVASTGTAAAGSKLAPALAATDAWIESNRDTLLAVNQRIWRHPEVGLQETHAVAELTALLERGGFRVERGVAGMPTAFVASAGSGRPILGILAEYDALPGTSQAAAPEKRKRDGDDANDAGRNRKYLCAADVEDGTGSEFAGAAGTSWVIAAAPGGWRRSGRR